MPSTMFGHEQASTSIYARPWARQELSCRSRTARRLRLQQRLWDGPEGRPPTELDRIRRLRTLMGRSSSASPMTSQIRALVESIREEVERLEAWAASRPADLRTSGETTRRALEFLRNYGHLSLLDFASVSWEARPALVTWLGLEHRWCYAAAGTDREAFTLAIGRTGAR